MKFSVARAVLLTSAAACALFAAAPALAQTTPAATPPTPAADAQAEGTEVGEVVVTGTRIPQPNLTSVSPVTVVGQQDIQLQGVTRTEDLVNRLPQAFASQGSAISNGSTGTATVDLRGLGANRTLVLLDGRRLLSGDPGGSGLSASAADLNFIPSALVDRVELVTGGASAVYGADAVSGVVNFIMQRNFEGVRVDAQYSFYEHENDNDRVQTILQRRGATAQNPAAFRVPERDVTDGYGRDITAVIGVNSPDGRGNVTAYASWRNIDPAVQANRDYSACSLGENDAAVGLFDCAGSSTTSPARFIVAAGTGGSFTLDPTTPRGFRPYSTARDAFNFAPYNYYQRPDERYTLGAFAHYQIDEAADVYGQFMFMDDHTRSVVAPSGIFLQTVTVNCTGNPLISAIANGANPSQFTTICGPTVDQDAVTPGVQTDADPSTPGQQAAVTIGKRNVEGGGRINDLRHTDYRIVMGVRGDVGGGWRYDLYGQFSTVVFADNFLNDISLSRINRSLDVIADGSGAPVCRSAASGLDPNCVPYDIFGAAGPSQAALNYIQVPGFQEGSSQETVINGSVTGSLGDYGIRSPFATDGVGVALGFEYRREALELRTDLEFSSGDLTGQGGPVPSLGGDFDLYELFGELRIPVLQDLPFARSLTLEVGYRYSDYSLGFDTDTYKVAGDWEPIEGLRIRASYNRAVRAPNVVELFLPQVVGLDGTVDPCAGPIGTPGLFSLAQCQRTGVSPAQYGNIVPSTQYNGLVGGNPNLAPETADTRSLGVVFTPTFLPRFSLSVDYYDIKVQNRIGQIGADVIISRCGVTGDPFYCNLVRRQPGTGSLFFGTVGFIADTNFNTGSLRVSGVDVEANYRFNFDDFSFTSFLGDYGGLSINYVGSYLDRYEIETLPGDPTFNCAGFYGSVCTGSAVPSSAPLNQYRHQARLTWNTPWRLTASVNWRHYSAVDIDSSSTEVVANGGRGGGVFAADRTLDSQDYFDLSAVYRAWTGVAFRVGVNNVFDRDPPLVGSLNCPTGGSCNGNTFPQTYDSLGRFIFFGVSADF